MLTKEIFANFFEKLVRMIQFFLMSKEDKIKVFPSYKTYRKDNIAHINLTNKYYSAKYLVNLFDLDYKKVIFFVYTDNAIIEYNDALAVIGNTKNDVLFLNGLSFNTYVFNLSIEYHTLTYGYLPYKVDISCNNRFGERCEYNSIFHKFPSDLELFQALFGNSVKDLPNRLEHYISYLEVLNSNFEKALIYSLFLSDDEFKKNIKELSFFVKEFQEYFFSNTYLYEEGILSYHDLSDFFDKISSKSESFSKLWKMEKRRSDFVKYACLEDYFWKNFRYCVFNDDDSQFAKFFFYLRDLYEILSFLENKEIDEEKVDDKIVDLQNKRKSKEFFSLLRIIYNSKDSDIISFVNLNSNKSIDEQLEKNTNLIIVKLPVIDSQNQEIKEEMIDSLKLRFLSKIQYKAVNAKVEFIWFLPPCLYLGVFLFWQ